MKAHGMTEHDIQTTILREFATRPNLRLWRNNTGSAVPLATIRAIQGALGRGDVAGAMAICARARPISFGVAGQADLSGIILGSGRRLEIEVKSATGRQREDQKAFGAMVTQFGGIYVLARSVADVEGALL